MGPSIALPPTGLVSEEPEMESTAHLLQLVALLTSLRWWWRHREDFFAAGNLTLYFSALQARTHDFRGPDFFVVLDTTPEPRDAWVVWEEGGRSPNVIVEIASPSTAAEDRGPKRRVYEQVLRTPEYVMFDPADGAVEVLRHGGAEYRRVEADARGLFASEQLGLAFGVHGGQLRFFTTEGVLVPTPEEAAAEAERAADAAQRAADAAERAADEAQRAADTAQRAADTAQRAADAAFARAETEAARATDATARAQRLAERLRALGEDPDAL